MQIDGVFRRLSPIAKVKRTNEFIKFTQCACARESSIPSGFRWEFCHSSVKRYDVTNKCCCRCVSIDFGATSQYRGKMFDFIAPLFRVMLCWLLHIIYVWTGYWRQLCCVSGECVDGSLRLQSDLFCKPSRFSMVYRANVFGLTQSSRYRESSFRQPINNNKIYIDALGVYTRSGSHSSRLLD